MFNTCVKQQVHEVSYDLEKIIFGLKKMSSIYKNS